MSITHQSLSHRNLTGSVFSRLRFPPTSRYYGYNPKKALHFYSPANTSEQSRTILACQRLGVSTGSLRDNFLSCKRNSGFCVSAENGEGNCSKNSEEFEARRDSTMPERFRYLTKEVPEPPIRWPWFVALAFLIYAWRAVLFELANWRKTAIGITRFVGYLLKLLLAVIYHFIGDPLTSTIRFIETILYIIRDFYFILIAHAPIWDLTASIVLASTVLALAEAAVPDSVNRQPHLLTLSGVVGYATVTGGVSEPVFWTLLLGVYGFSRIVKKRDNVSSALPAAAVLAAVGDPWVRFMAIASYMALAVSQNWKKSGEGKEEEGEVEVSSGRRRRRTLPLMAAALAVGIRVAANWARYRHLTWMIV